MKFPRRDNELNIIILGLARLKKDGVINRLSLINKLDWARREQKQNAKKEDETKVSTIIKLTFLFKRIVIENILTINPSRGGIPANEKKFKKKIIFCGVSSLTVCKSVKVFKLNFISK